MYLSFAQLFVIDEFGYRVQELVQESIRFDNVEFKIHVTSKIAERKVHVAFLEQNRKLLLFEQDFIFCCFLFTRRKISWQKLSELIKLINICLPNRLSDE